MPGSRAGCRWFTAADLTSARAFDNQAQAPERKPRVTVERIFNRASPGGTQTEHLAVRVVAGAGIEGDRYFARKDVPGQTITCIEAEEVEAFFARPQRPADRSATGRNVVTRGVRLSELAGAEFGVGAGFRPAD